MKFSTICIPVKGDKSQRRVDAFFLAVKKLKIGKDLLNGWGGKMEEGDATLIEAALRELKEEGGIIANPDEIELAAMIDFYSEDEHVFTCGIYLVWSWEGEIAESGEMGPAEEFAVDGLQIALGRMLAGDRHWFPHIIRGERIGGIIRYSKDFSEVLEFSCEPLSSGVS